MTSAKANLPHILLVDDDDRIRALLKQYFETKGFRCATGRNAAEAELFLSVLRFDLMVLDVMMPGENGRDFAARLVGSGETMPIILLTALGNTEDKVGGLRAGVDDYVPKPCHPEELVLRIRAILRRSSASERERPQAAILEFGEFVFDSQKGRLRRGGDHVHLTQTDISMLNCLAQTPNEIVPRERFAAITDAGPDSDRERIVDVMMSRLRKKIEADPRRPRHIRTIRGIGYTLQTN
ncbi:MAG: response regulator transcription factor [Albidovulum sp.]|nr:response regulator transcription factor [Albidovulum sp.]MDE0303556.1 response regulator transcription factor [Albidovulum sp.]MDE0531787.1 response regulator transcription factor [Albidovulum sp.]